MVYYILYLYFLKYVFLVGVICYFVLVLLYGSVKKKIFLIYKKFFFIVLLKCIGILF